MNQKLKIIIAAHTFPPTPGIGGRRWAKLSKYLIRKGHSVEVVSARQAKGDGSPWERDVQGIDQHHYAHRFPEILTKSPKTVGEKLNYRLALRKMRKASKGTPYDRALLDQLPFLDLLEQRIMTFQPDAVIATGAPFRLLHYTVKLRDKYPNVKFIADFRDPWTWGETFGYKSLPQTRLKVEQEMESEVCEKFDLILSPWSEIIGILQSKYPACSGKMYTLSHGFDPDDLHQGQVSFREGVHQKVLIYGGTVYESFAKQLVQLSSLISEKNIQAEIHVYTSDSKLIEKLPAVQVFEPIASAQFFQKARESDWLLFPIPEHAKNGVPTKLYEYAALKKPILGFGSNGAVANFIETKGIGHYLHEFRGLNEILEADFEMPKDVQWLSEYSIDMQTQELISLIEKIGDES